MICHTAQTAAAGEQSTQIQTIAELNIYEDEEEINRETNFVQSTKQARKNTKS